MSDFLIVMAVVWITIALMTGSHADHQGKDGVQWAVIVGVFGIFGLIGYAISLASD